MTALPITRNPSRIVRVDGEFAGRPVVYEIYTDEWRSCKTGRYRRCWHARQAGSLAWHMASTARGALAMAACEHGGRHPRWLAVASSVAQEKLREGKER